MDPSRRDFLKGAGALIVSFDMVSLTEAAIGGQDQFATHPSHIDPQELDSWLAIGADGTITAYTGKCDFGQGIFTAQTQLVAEELCVAIERVKLIQCDTAVTPDQGSTSGSQSTPTNFNTQNLALAAATAREALLKLAAERLGEPVETLTVANGMISARARKQVKYEELIGSRHFHLPLSKTAKRKSPSEWAVLGKSVPSLDRTTLMTGQFEFLHHIRVPGMLHARVVRPPEMGATLLSISEDAVKGIPGFVKAVVRKDFIGVVAKTQYAAVRAARQLKVNWKSGPKLPPQESFFEHIKTQSSHDSLDVDSNDIKMQLANSRHIVRARYTYPFQMHGSLGASCAVADVSRDSATIWSATQAAYQTRSVAAMLLGLSPDRVRVIYTRGSGCYGLNGADAVSFDAAVLSQEVGAPVRLQFSRQDEMMWENLGNACLVEHRAGLTADGKITAWDRESWVPSLGSRPGYNRPGNVISGMLLGYDPEPLRPGPAKPTAGELRNGSNTVPPYMAGCIDGNCYGAGIIRGERVLTHTVRAPFFTGPLRSPLRIQNTFANECFMDELSAQINADPVEFRLRHLKDERLIAVVRSAAKEANWETRSSPRNLPHDAQNVEGRGIACVVYEGRNSYSALVAEVNVDLATGIVRPKRFVIAVDCGPVSNPDGLRNQIEGGILQGMSRALVEEVTWDERRITSTDWETYSSLRLDYEMPPVEMVVVPQRDAPATGAGELSITVAPAAIGNAIYDATGVRLRDIPFTPARMKAALHKTASKEEVMG
jgi:CO/xanthine dehydrogenase Mo-binding subunit